MSVFFVTTDALQLWMFCIWIVCIVTDCLVVPDVWSTGRFVALDVLLYGCFVTDVLSRRLVAPDVLSPDVFSGHHK